MELVADCSPSHQAERAEAPSPPSRFIARQPILNLRGEVLGYELLSRQGWENWFSGELEDATRKTLDLCLYLGIETLANNSLAFVHCTRESIVEKLVTLLPAAKTVLEIPVTVEPDAALLEACTALGKMGYRIALDDFSPRPDLQPLLEIADYVKVDFRLSDAYLRRQIHRMMRYSHAVLLAEQVEDQSQFRIAREEGFQLFQGYFFCHPKVIANHDIPTNRLIYLRLLAELTRKPLNLVEITRIVGLEASLCYRLLRLANSALWARDREVASILEALMMVGEDRFHILVSVAASCALSQNQTPALISLSLQRARFCELLAPLVGEDPNEQFMLGLLSLLDAMLETSMESIIKTLPLRLEARAALLGTANPTAAPLCLVRSFESGTWANCDSAANHLAVSEHALTGLYLDSVKWATDSLA